MNESQKRIERIERHKTPLNAVERSSAILSTPSRYKYIFLYFIFFFFLSNWNVVVQYENEYKFMRKERITHKVISFHLLFCLLLSSYDRHQCIFTAQLCSVQFNLTSSSSSTCILFCVMCVFCSFVFFILISFVALLNSPTNAHTRCTGRPPSCITHRTGANGRIKPKTNQTFKITFYFVSYDVFLSFYSISRATLSIRRMRTYARDKERTTNKNKIDNNNKIVWMKTERRNYWSCAQWVYAQ